ncbi:MAG: aminotransferase class I/II-fold pyridoxal phosphate-dependent enzyme [Anaerolineae bacterium]|nr:aminotransferase class I/II-fold pyridoxal phosphate-dependent enzyme [Anaerolineae bacterium]
MKTGKATQAIHGRRDKSYRSANYPIYNSATFAVSKSSDYDHLDSDKDTHIYTRYSNPTIRNVEEKLAKLESTDGGVLFASGMAAITTTILTFAQNGDAIAVSSRLYGVAQRFLRDMAPQLGIDVHFLDADELYDLKEYAPTAKLVYFETPNNPTCACLSISEVVRAAQEIGALTVIDNTFATPINQNPAALGVDVIIHSATKYIGGHSDLMAGAALSDARHTAQIHEMMALWGGCSNPAEAALIDRSLKTLKVRVEAHNQTAQTLADFFSAEPKVRRVHYPGLSSSSDHAVASAQMSGYGGMLAIELESLSEAKTFCDKLQVALNATSLGSVETLVSLPVLTSHRSLSEEERERAGVTPGTIRISTGLEEVDDLIADFKQALAAI